MNSDTGDIVKILLASLLLFLFIAPMTSSYEPTNVIAQIDSPSAPAQEILQYSLPDTNIPITVGEVSGNRGFAYILEDESRLYFVDQVQEDTTFIDLPAGVKANGAYMIGYDVDLDGSDEFFLRNYVNPTYYCKIRG